MTKPAEATLGDISLNRLAVCECSDFNVCFVLEPFGVSDGPLSLHVERIGSNAKIGESVL